MFPAKTNVPFPVQNRYPAGGVVLLGGVIVAYPALLGLIGVALLRDTARATAKSVAGIGLPMT